MILNTYISYICAFLVCTMDLFLCLMVFQIIGHIKILRHALRSFPTVKSQNDQLELHHVKETASCDLMFNKQENDIIKTKIKECVEHHLLIVNFADDISQFFGPLLAINYLNHLIILSLLLLECLQGV
uniref:Odorant receptor n=1 Tax=Leucinodes orbonalis TaxID=711050 RepID=A0AAU0QLS4_9NEOP|nr:odorant receptor [Leucinodes orbonalis]